MVENAKVDVQVKMREIQISDGNSENVFLLISTLYFYYRNL